MAIGFILGRVLGGMTGVALALLGAGVWSLVAQQILLSLAPSCFLFVMGLHNDQACMDQVAFGLSITIRTKGECT